MTSSSDCSQTFDVIVVGGGVEGSATAYYLTSRHTKNVLLLEQFQASHLKGSSRGGSRMFHTNYGSTQYIKLIQDSLPIWEELQEKSGKTLIWKSGALAFSQVGSGQELTTRLKSLTDNGVSCEALSAEDARSRYPHQLNTPTDYECLFLPGGGSIDAALTVKTMQELFVRNGGVFKDCHKVVRLVPGPVVTVETDKGSFKGKKVVLATGAWTNEVLEASKIGIELPIKIFQTEVFYFKVSNPEHFNAKTFPIFFESIFDRRIAYSFGAVYGIPILEIPNMVKVCNYYGNDVEIEIEDITKPVVPGEKSLPAVQKFIGTHFKGVDVSPAVHETCVYAKTPDNNPIIDRHPDHPNITVATAFSHGFKMSPVLGKIIAEVALELPPSYDLTIFRLKTTQ